MYKHRVLGGAGTQLAIHLINTVQFIQTLPGRLSQAGSNRAESDERGMFALTPSAAFNKLARSCHLPDSFRLTLIHLRYGTIPLFVCLHRQRVVHSCTYSGSFAGGGAHVHQSLSSLGLHR